MPARAPRSAAPKKTKPASKDNALVRPYKLYKGRKVALVAPAFTFDPNLVEQGRSHLESKYGLKTVMLDNIRDQDCYFAGSDARRTDELFHWLTTPDVHAVLAVRGGYGCARIYPALAERLRGHKNLKPKIVLGYSDVTILLNGLHQDFGWVTFHTPVLTGRPFRAPLPIEEQTFHRALFTTEPLGPVTDPDMISLSSGSARGKLVGGCLSIVVSSLGTPYEVQTDDKILFLEDVDEKPYRIDRMLIQLLHAGKLDKVRGIVFGQLVHCDPSPESRDPSQTDALGAVRSALDSFLKQKKIPVLYNFPAGHGMPQSTFPIGCEVELRASARPELVFLEAGVK